MYRRLDSGSQTIAPTVATDPKPCGFIRQEGGTIQSLELFIPTGSGTMGQLAPVLATGGATIWKFEPLTEPSGGTIQ